MKLIDADILTDKLVGLNDYRKVCEIIHNTPAVEAIQMELHEKILNQTVRELFKCQEELEKVRNEKRPTGEWIAREDMDYLDKNNVYHNHFMCEKCGFIHDFLDGHTSQYEYCPACGAKLDFVWL